jgi:hypothetical protein
MKESLGKIPSHPKFKNKTNSDQENKSQIGYKN